MIMFAFPSTRAAAQARLQWKRSGISIPIGRHHVQSSRPVGVSSGPTRSFLLSTRRPSSIKYSPPRPPEPKESTGDRLLFRGIVVAFLVGVAGICYGGYKAYVYSDASVKKWREEKARNKARLKAPSYLPLEGSDHIRVLVLEPATSSKDPVKCRLRHCALSDKPPYEALSYVWGAANNATQQEIFIDGKAVLVGASLYDALESLRLRDGPRILWVDALSINQADDMEKSQQVTMMTDIYAKSRRAVIWLGKETAATKNAMKTLKDLDAYFDKRIWFYIVSPIRFASMKAMLPESMMDLDAKDVEKLKSLDLASVIALCNHPWPSRAWTLQEFAQAPDAIVVHGAQSLPSQAFFRPIYVLQLSRHRNELLGPLFKEGRDTLTMNNFTKVEILMNDWVRMKYHSLLDAMAINSDRNATDPRDRVYAYRGAATDYDDSDWEILPDYTASLEEVYIRFARWCLLRKKDLRCLLMAGGTTSLDIPSWVPDWRPGSEQDPLEVKNTLGSGYIFDIEANTIHLKQDTSQASLGTGPDLFWSPAQPRVLHIKGRIVDKLNQLSVSRVQLITLDHRNVDTGGETWKLFQTKLYKKASKSEGDPLFQYARDIAEAQLAIDKFGCQSLPGHIITDVVWMEDCKQIARSLNGKAKMMPSDSSFEYFWRSMNMNQDGDHKPETAKKNFWKYITFLEQVRDGTRSSVPPLVGTAAAIYRKKVAGARQSRMKQHQQDRPLVKPYNTKASESDAAEIELRSKMHMRWSSIVSKRFCSTTNSRLGWVPLRAQAGDVVCIFNGANVPYILRPLKGVEKEEYYGVFSVAYWKDKVIAPASTSPSTTSSDDGKTQYKLVGPCYMQGIMEGEIIKSPDRSVETMLEIC